MVTLFSLVLPSAGTLSATCASLRGNWIERIDWRCCLCCSWREGGELVGSILFDGLLANCGLDVVLTAMGGGVMGDFGDLELS